MPGAGRGGCGAGYEVDCRCEYWPTDPGPESSPSVLIIISKRSLYIVIFSPYSIPGLSPAFAQKNSEGDKEQNSPRKKKNEPSSTINAWTSLRNEHSSLARIDENSGSPDPLTLAKYAAKIVETPPRTATAAPIYKNNSSWKPLSRETARKRPYVRWPCGCDTSGHRAKYNLQPYRSVDEYPLLFGWNNIVISTREEWE